MSEELNKWLEWSNRDPCPYFKFDVIDVREKCIIDDEIETYICNSFIYERFDFNFIRDQVEDLGWVSVVDLIFEGESESISRSFKGDIGEVFFSIVLRGFHDYIIPIPKIRYKLITGQTLPRTDILALKVNQSQNITEVCYAEVKLRTVSDNNAAKDSYDQLMEAFNLRRPSILKFVAARMKEILHPLYNSFRIYLRKRQDSRDIDNFQIGLCWDTSIWNEKVLENLEVVEIELPRLTVQVLQINNLNTNLNEIFNVNNQNWMINDD